MRYLHVFQVATSEVYNPVSCSFSVCDFCTSTYSSRFTMQMLMGDFCLKQYDITAHVGIKQVNNKYSRGVSVGAMKGQKLFGMLALVREKLLKS